MKLFHCWQLVDETIFVLVLMWVLWKVAHMPQKKDDN